MAPAPTTYSAPPDHYNPRTSLPCICVAERSCSGVQWEIFSQKFLGLEMAVRLGVGRCWETYEKTSLTHD